MRRHVCTLILVSLTAVSARAQDAGEAPDGWVATIDGWLGVAVKKIFNVLFYDLGFGRLPGDAELPALIVWLAGGAIALTLYHGFINARGFGHALAVIRGKWARPGVDGDISQFQAFTSALSATVGLGNIASVATAMVVGGPGALLWMLVLGFCGMTVKFHETTLAQLYRIQNADGTISGGPMFFISRGFRQIHPALGGLGTVVAVVFAVMLMFAALGGGNLYQANQAFEGFFSQFVQPGLTPEQIQAGTVRNSTAVAFGIVMCLLVGVVVLGGIRRIGRVTSVIVPLMAVVYVAACWVIIGMNIQALPALLATVFREALTPEAGLGGVIGAMMVGFRRAAFSSESGIGSSAVAHAAARTAEPVREGFVAALEPFVDTIIICSTTGLMVLITGAYAAEGLGGDGAAVTLHAFQQSDLLVTLQFPKILAISIVLFAFSTMISWCYYGERAWGYLFGIRSVLIFRIVFVGVVFLGAIASGGNAIGLADASLLACAIPNLLGCFILAPIVKRRLKAYWREYRGGTLVAGEAIDHPMPK